MTTHTRTRVRIRERAHTHTCALIYTSAYDAWWQRVLPHLENEEAYKTAPKINPFKEEYWKQMGGKP